MSRLDPLSSRTPEPGWRDQRPTAIVAAFRQELAPLLRRMQLESRFQVQGQPFFLGSLNRSPVVLTWTGEGRRNAEAGLAALFGRFTVSGALGLGVAGALSPALEVGSLVVAQELWQGAERVRLDTQGGLQAEPRGGLEAGTVVTVEDMVTLPEDKAALWHRVGRPAAAVVDMESVYLARAAVRQGVPFLIVRGISDAADDELPPFLNHCRDHRGGVSRGKVVAYALTHPGVVGSLWRIERRVRHCALRLADLAEALLAEDPFGRNRWPELHGCEA